MIKGLQPKVAVDINYVLYIVMDTWGKQHRVSLITGLLITGLEWNPKICFYVQLIGMQL